MGAPAAESQRSARPRQEWVAVALVAACATVVAGLMLGRSLPHPTSAPHFQLLARSFLEGRLDVPPGTYDAAFYGGRLYLPFGPLPAILLLPAVALFGTGFPVGALGVAAAAVAIPSLWRVFRRVGVEAPVTRAWLLLAALAGTCYLSALTIDSSYFVTHLVVIACLAPALALALGGRAPAAAGLLVGLATMARAPAVLAVVPLAALYLDHAGATLAGRRLAQLGAGLVPPLALVAAYNMARFGSPLEAGYTYQLQADPTLAVARAAGTLALAHLPKNLYTFLIAPPLLVGGNSAPVVHYPFLVPSDWGMGLVFVSPWLFAGLWARGRRAAILAAGSGLLLLPGLLQFGGGWVQFGYRYSLDALPFTAALAAAAIAQRRRAGWLPPVASLCLLVNAWGADWLIHRLGG